MLIALVHIPHVHVMANAANVLPTIAEVEKHRDASFPNPVKKLMTGQLKISIKIIKRTVNNCPFYKNQEKPLSELYHDSRTTP